MPRQRSTKPRPSTGGPPFVPPYSPSWFDRLTVLVDRLPGPAWAFYLAMGIVASVAGTAIQWREGAYPTGTFVPLHVWTFANFAYLLAFMHYLDKSAASAMAYFRPLLTARAAGGSPSTRDGGMFARLSYELTTLPAWPTRVATFAVIVLTVAAYFFQTASAQLPAYLAGTASTPLSTASAMALFLVSAGIQGVLVYHTIHQLTLISRIYTQHARINLYQLQPLYALSVPTAITAIGLLLYMYVWYATSISMSLAIGSVEIGPVEIGTSATFAAIAIATFTLPFLGAHRRLEAEKNRSLAEAASRFEELTGELLRAVDAGRLDKMDPLNKALVNLEIVQNGLRRVPSWPWQPGAVRGLLAAIFLPIAVWAIQLILARLLGP